VGARLSCAFPKHRRSHPDGDGDGDLWDAFPDRGDHELAQCEVDRGAAEARIVELEAELDLCRMASDADGDGVPDGDDFCPETGSALPVDAAGCSHAQFCVAIEIDGLLGPLECVTAQWSGAEPPSAGRCRIQWSSGLACGVGQRTRR